MADNIQEKIEDKVIDLIALGAGGRLIVFKPQNSAKSLIVEKKGDYKKESISLKVCNTEEQNFIEAVGNFNPEDNFYLVFVNFDMVKQDINDNLWVVPSFNFQEAGEKKDFSKFLMDKKNFVTFLIDKFSKK